MVTRCVQLLPAVWFLLGLAAGGTENGVKASVVSSATYDKKVSPGSLATIFGSGMADNLTQAALDANGNLPFELDGISVDVNGHKARLIYTSPEQINFVVPDGLEAGSATVTVHTRDGRTTATSAEIRPTAPGLFAIDCLRPNRAAALNGVTYAPESFQALTPGISGADKRTRLSLFGTGIRGAGGGQRSDLRHSEAGTVRIFITKKRAGSAYQLYPPLGRRHPIGGRFFLGRK